MCAHAWDKSSRAERRQQVATRRVTPPPSPAIRTTRLAATNANTILDVLADDDDVNLSRRERIESLAREAVHRGKIDSERLDRDEKILGMVLHNRQVEV